MLTDRANAICLLEILREYSDEANILPMREIISKMNTIYGLKPDRRTIYSAVALLSDLGYDISLYEENGVGYFLRNREFEDAEVLLLTDAVYSFPFVPARQSEDLIRKLQKLVSVHQRKKYRHLTIVRQDKKTDNRQLFWNIDRLDEAIHEKKQVSFTYVRYGLDKKLHPSKEKPYVVNPYGMVYMNEHYYLVCNLSGYPKTSLYRIDRIKDIEILEKLWDKEPESKEQVRDAVYAFAGKPERITMYCDSWMIGDVIDKFGSGITVSERDEESIMVSFTAPPQGVRFWALQYLPYVEVVEPKWLREEIADCVKQNRYGIMK